MKSLFTFLVVLLLNISLLHQSHGQTSFTDDFEAYASGVYLGTTGNIWTTWEKKPGTDQDVKVTDEKAKSGTKSIKFEGAADGGPSDVILPFGARRASGKFLLGMNMLIPAAKNGYFNLQGTTTPGTTYALDVYFYDNGVFAVTGSSTVFLTGRYPQDEWFNFKVDINFTANSWKILLNDNCVGAFFNPQNGIASMDLYPINENSVFYVDDVSYDYQTTAPSFTKEAGISAPSWTAGNLTGTSDYLTFNLRNNGADRINNAEMNVTVNGVFAEKFTLTGQNIIKNKVTPLKLTKPTVLVEGDNLIVIELSSLNGAAGDEEACNDRIEYLIQATTPAVDKAVLVEEATGTWCQWCPRGAVFMDLLSKRYTGRFIPIAVHNGDPMTVTAYDALVRSTPGFSGYPSAVVDRISLVDPSGAESPFINEIRNAPVAKIKAGAKFDSITRILDVSALVEFKADATNGYWVQLAVTEDHVTGTDVKYNQSNAYAGGSNGIMGGYETLPNPVPAAQMVYDHVARGILGIELSPENSFEGDFKAGDQKLVTYSVSVPTGINVDNMHIIPILMSYDGYENAISATLFEAKANGYLSSSNDVPTTITSLNLFPNPASDYTNIEVNFNAPTKVSIDLTDLTGKVMYSRDYGMLNGSYSLPINVSNMIPGMYIAKINTTEGCLTRKIAVSK